MYILVQKDHVRTLKYRVVHVRVRRKHQNNPACTKSVSLQHVEIGHDMEEEDLPVKEFIDLVLFTRKLGESYC